MQSQDEKASAIIDRAERMNKAKADYKDPLRKNLIKTLADDGESKVEIYRMLVNAYAFILQFTDFESGGVMGTIFGVDILHEDGVLGTFDKDTATIIFNIDDKQASDNMTIVNRTIDEKNITVPLARIYDSYDARLCFLVTHYYQAYKTFKLYSAELQKLTSSLESPLPPIAENISNQILEKINTLVSINATMGVEPRTPKWQEIRDKLNTPTQHHMPTGSKIFDQVANKYFHLPYFPGSQLNELLTVACFIQQTIVYVGSAYDKEYLLNFLNSDFYKNRWEKHVSIQSHAAINNDSNRGQLLIEFDKGSVLQARDYRIITKIVNWEKLKLYLSPEAIDKIPNKINYFRTLNNEIETFFSYQQKSDVLKMQQILHPDLQCISLSDFALEYLQPSVINTAASAFENNDDQKQIYYKEIMSEATALIAYAKIKSSGHVCDLTEINIVLLMDQEPATLEEVRKNFAKGYFNFSKIESTFEALTTSAAKLHFLLNVFVCARLLIMKVRSQLKFIQDPTNYDKARKVIAQITNGDAAEEKPIPSDIDLSLMKVVELPPDNNDEKQSAATIQRIPFMGLNYKYQNPIKENAITTLRADIDSNEEMYSIILKIYGFILKFCEYESSGQVTDILGIKMPQIDVVLGTFDKDLSKIKWHPEKIQHYEDEIILKKILEEKAITTPLSDVYDNYEKKMFHLSMLFCHTYADYQGIQKALQNSNPLVIYPYLPDCPKDNLSRRLINQIVGLKASQMANGKEPSTTEWDETHKRITSTVSTLILPALEDEPEVDTLDPHEKTFNKYFYRPYYPGSELNELLTAACFIQETIFFVAHSLGISDLTKVQGRWDKNISVKCSRDQDGQLVVNINKNNFQKVRDVSIINRLIKLGTLNKYLSRDIIEKQGNKSVYLKTLFNEIEAFITSGICTEHEKQKHLSDFVVEYLNPEKLLAVLRAGPVNEHKELQALHYGMHTEAAALMNYADIASHGLMREITGFELSSALTGKKPTNLNEVYKSFSGNFFQFVKLVEPMKNVKGAADKLHFLTNIHISAGLLILRLKSPSQHIIDTIDYSMVRGNIARQAAPRSEGPLANQLISSSLDALLDDRIQQDHKEIISQLSSSAIGRINSNIKSTQTPLELALELMENLLQEAKQGIWPVTIEDSRIKQVIIEKYFNSGNIDNSDFVKGLCFIQAAFNVATNNYFLDTEYKYRSQIIQQRWNKQLSVQPKNSIDPNTSHFAGIVFAYDKQKPQQVAEVAKLKTLLNLDNINRHISMQAAYIAYTEQTFAQVNQQIRKLFAEIEDYFVDELQKTPYKHFSRHLDTVYISDFAKTKLRHMAVEELAAKYSASEDITDLRNDLSIGINLFMEYCDRLTQGLLPSITGIDYQGSPTNRDAPIAVGTTLAKLRENANFYVDVYKFEKELNERKSYKAKLEFLAAEYTQAYAIDKNMIRTAMSVNILGIAPVRRSVTPPIYKVDTNKTKLEINKIIRAYETPSDEKSAQLVKQKEKPKKKTTPTEGKTQEAADRKTQEAVKTKGTVNNTPPTPPTPPANPKLQAFKIDYTTTKSQIKILDSKIETLQDELKNLVKQLKETFALDNKERQYDLRPRKTRVNDLVDENITKIVLLDMQLQKILGEIKPDDETKLEENQTRLDDIKVKIPALETNQEKLLVEIREESTVLDRIIPKKTLKKNEEAYQEAQRKKERLAREKKEEEIHRPKKEKVERPKAKPSLTPVPTLTSPTKKLTVQAKKTEHKSSKPDPQTPLRLLHLNEACFNLIFIQKMLTIHKSDLSPEVIHYALLYNIFRCFQSLKMYQQKGGQQRSINPDEVANLRNMIIHHGASSAHPEAVEAFAENIKAKLPQQLLKLTNRSLSCSELQAEQRQQLMAEFNLLEPAIRYSGFLDHSTLVLDDTELYKKLAVFHEQKTDNNDSALIVKSILGTYIPLIKAIIPPLAKAASLESEMKPEHFFDTFYFQLQALRMLATICGEFEAHFKQLHTEKNFQVFLQFCRNDVRNIVAHEPRDFIESLDFFRRLNSLVSKVEEKKILDKMKPKKANTAAFFNASSNSAMDAKYDRKPGPPPGKGLNL